jgi:hypothetical protein
MNFWSLRVSLKLNIARGQTAAVTARNDRLLGFQLDIKSGEWNVSYHFIL